MNDGCHCDSGYVWDAVAGTCVSSVVDQCAPSCGNGTCVGGHCRCWAGFAGAHCTTVVPRPNTNTGVGVGVSGMSYWSTQWTYADLMFSSSAWVSNWDSQYQAPGLVRKWGNGPQVIVNASTGWPTQILPGQRLGKLLARNVRQHIPRYYHDDDAMW